MAELALQRARPAPANLSIRPCTPCFCRHRRRLRIAERWSFERFAGAGRARWRASRAIRIRRESPTTWRNGRRRNCYYLRRWLGSATRRKQNRFCRDWIICLRRLCHSQNLAGEFGLPTSRGIATYRAVLSLHQTWIILNHLRDQSTKSVVEIGPGLGRTAYYVFRSRRRGLYDCRFAHGDRSASVFSGRCIGP